MEQQSHFQKLKEKIQAKKKLIFWIFGGAAVAGFVVGIVLVGPKIMQKGREIAATKGGIVHALRENFERIQTKMHMIQVAVEENRRLQLENSHLRSWAEALRFDCSAIDSKRRTGELGLKLDRDTGSRVGRALASIPYTPPAHLLPPQLFTLGVSYFKGGEAHKAAVIFTFLTGLDDNDAYKTPKNHLLTGVAWYRVENFKIADYYFGKVLSKDIESMEALPYQAQARLWRGLVAERMDRHRKSQFWLRELVDFHPHSTEASWINPLEVDRVPTSKGPYGAPQPRD